MKLTLFSEAGTGWLLQEANSNLGKKKPCAGCVDGACGASGAVLPSAKAPRAQRLRSAHGSVQLLALQGDPNRFHMGCAKLQAAGVIVD